MNDSHSADPHERTANYCARAGLCRQTSIIINSRKMPSTISPPAAYLSRNLGTLARTILRRAAAFYRLGETPKLNRCDVINVLVSFMFNSSTFMDPQYGDPTATKGTLLP